MTKLTLPALLALVGVMLLIGCIPIPGSFKTDNGKPRPEESIGERESKRPLRKGVATREAVFAALGPPTSTTPDGRTVYYNYVVNTSSLLGPLCILPQYGSRYLRLDFDANNVLTSYKVTKQPELDRATLQPYRPTNPTTPPRAPSPASAPADPDFWTKPAPATRSTR